MDDQDPVSPLSDVAISASAPESGGGDHPIGDLVHQLLDAVQFVFAEADLLESADTSASLRPAEFCYELDSVISQYLEHNALSACEYDHIQKQVVNSLAHHLTGDGTLRDGDPSGGLLPAADCHVDGHLAHDQHGNADMADVLHLLDHHFSAELHALNLCPGGVDVHSGPDSALGGHG
jgi:hypothetical protein